MVEADIASASVRNHFSRVAASCSPMGQSSLKFLLQLRIANHFVNHKETFILREIVGSKNVESVEFSEEISRRIRYRIYRVDWIWRAQIRRKLLCAAAKFRLYISR